MSALISVRRPAFAEMTRVGRVPVRVPHANFVTDHGGRGDLDESDHVGTSLVSSRAKTDGTERFVPEEFGPLPGYEHAHRYLAASLIFDKGRILDLASGSGAGTSALRAMGSLGRAPNDQTPRRRRDRKASAIQVVGLDLDLASARNAAPAVQGDAARLPFADASFDGVICFEAIEHMDEPSHMLEEIRRVLRPGGVALLSTPNRDVFTARAGRNNPFHVSEMNPEELFKLMSATFPQVALYSQSVWAGSWLSELGEGGASAPETTTQRWRVATQDLAPERDASVAPWADRTDPQVPSPLYIMAVCSMSAKGLERAQRVLGANHLLNDSAQWLLGHYLESLRGLAERDALMASHALHGRNLKELNDAAEERMRSLESHARNLETERDQLLAQMSLLEEHAANVAELDAIAQKRIVNLERHTANLETERAQLGHQISALEEHAINVAELDEFTRRQIVGLEEHTQNLETERGLLVAQISSLKEHAVNVAKLDEAARQRISSLETHAGNIELELEARSIQIANLDEALAAGGETIAGLRAQAETLRSERDNWQNRAETAQKDLAELHASRTVRFVTWLRTLLHS